MKVWNNGKWIDMEIGQEVTVLRFGGFLKDHPFGEAAKLQRVTKNHLIFETDSGAIVKTAIDNIHAVRGKAEKEGYSVSLKKISEFPNIIIERVKYWNRKKCCFETR